MDVNENSAGASEDQTADDLAVNANGMKTLSELLAASEDNADNEDSSGEDKAASSGSDKDTRLTKFNDLAGKLEMELDDLYKLELTLSEGGDPVTVEQLKDAYANKSDHDLNVIEFEERRTQEEQQMMRVKAELQEILQALPKQAVKPEVLEKIRAKAEATNKVERQKTLEVIPEWKDPKVRETEIAAMADHLQGYGFPVHYLKQVVSHQQLKYIRDNWRREERVRKAIEQVRAGKPGKTPASKAQKKAPKKSTQVSRVKRGSHSNRLEAAFSEID